jgi:hypothetical protein
MLKLSRKSYDFPFKHNGSSIMGIYVKTSPGPQSEFSGDVVGQPVQIRHR